MMNDFPTLLPNTMIDDYFIWGFISGFIGYLYYLYSSRNDPDNHLHWMIGLYGTILTGSLGGLLAIVIDRRIEISIIVGLTANLIYMGIVRAGKSNQFFTAMREVLIRYLTGGNKL